MYLYFRKPIFSLVGGSRIEGCLTVEHNDSRCNIVALRNKSKYSTCVFLNFVVFIINRQWHKNIEKKGKWSQFHQKLPNFHSVPFWEKNWLNNLDHIPWTEFLVENHQVVTTDKQANPMDAPHIANK